MNKLINLMGSRFGRLTVIKRIPNRKRHHKDGTWGRGNEKWGPTIWLCKCDCGEEKIIRGDSLRDGNTKSCGCLNKETASKLFKKESGLASMRQLIISYKGSAKRRGYNYKLTEKQFMELTQKDCYYCGAKPNNIQKTKGCNGNYIHNGIDRIDNTKDYTIDNVVPCCKICNQAKHTLTMQEFKDWIKKVYSNIFVWD
jgi:hypothetical protein